MPPHVDPGRCVGCAQCLFVCGRRVFILEAGRYQAKPVHAGRCQHCFICQKLCPHSAIRIRLPRRPVLRLLVAT